MMVRPTPAGAAARTFQRTRRSRPAARAASLGLARARASAPRPGRSGPPPPRVPAPPRRRARRLHDSCPAARARTAATRPRPAGLFPCAGARPRRPRRRRRAPRGRGSFAPTSRRRRGARRRRTRRRAASGPAMLAAVRGRWLGCLHQLMPRNLHGHDVGAHQGEEQDEHRWRQGAAICPGCPLPLCHSFFFKRIPPRTHTHASHASHTHT